MVFYKVTLARSLIGMPRATRQIVKTLGLGKRGSTVYKRATPAIAGSLLKVKELITVEVSPQKVSKGEMRLARKSNPGYVVEAQS
ncbi:mitochondrial 54S ribosomal protein uL30m KNAG_0G03480 [Huiozyma naganishii CBS 8797]|uniref:Large ribosomal subunit protein uL30m n=1 Tax=Huiozyma naganishii (strain ATCC MYA-139 / BCRC 22969 / CBS 8797 / KCTC 17520 / NBRC 10181 / NCYC 3082 / Yp74L-3) TaxID=1071383 RepID=J7S9A2_HUIN7|nr:hypothetical protein KNAG_0G03480 [Kazachstania naganishii CBS 8797]CCK71406.1 hypothetical protein KNAG_0G03480 [Kazachstania naganishii CBS 8797]